MLLDKFNVPILTIALEPSEYPVEDPVLNVPPLQTIPPPGLPVAIAVATPSCKIPAVIVVVPVYVFAIE